MVSKFVYKLLILLVVVFGISEKSSAQFEGEIFFRAFEPENIGETERFMQFIATSERIYLSSNDQYRVFAGMDANGILVRNDHNDFVFISGETDALRISREDVDGLANLIERMDGSSDVHQNQFDWDGSLKETGETKTISGYRTEQIIVYDDSNNSHVSVWLTDTIKINWGILHETWYNSMSKFVKMELPIEVFMNRNSFPLQIEYYRDDKLVSVVEATRVNKRSIESQLVDVPEGVKMLGITDLMMRMMQDRR